MPRPWNEGELINWEVLSPPEVILMFLEIDERSVRQSSAVSSHSRRTIRCKRIRLSGSTSFLIQRAWGITVEGVEDSWFPRVRNRSSRCHISERRREHLPGSALIPGPDEAGWKLARVLGPPRKRVGKNQFRRNQRRRAAREGK